MNETEQTFRTSAFGGFNRQDVLDYVESAARATNEQIAALTKEVEELRTAGEKSAAAEATLQAQCDALTKENERVTTALAEKTAAFELSETDLSHGRTEQEAVGVELATLTEENNRLRRSATAYAELKDRTGAIELEAHQRAMTIEHAAEEKAKKVWAEAEQLIYKVQTGYGRLRTDVDATVVHAAGELNRVTKTLEGVKAELAEHDAALRRLMDTCREGDARRAPNPLPIKKGDA